MNIFEITIQRKSGDNWPIVVEHSRPGELLPLRSEGSLKLTSENLQQLTSLLGQTQDYGTLLGKALFKDEIRDAFVGAVRESQEALRMLLFIEASDKELRNLRWEKLCAPIDGDWQLLALNQRVPFSFYIPAITDRRFPPIGRRDLKALVLVASPSDSKKYKLADFDVVANVNSVKTALGEIPCDVLATVDGAIGLPTLDELCSQLTDRTKQYTLLHFVSHGRVMDDGETLLYWSKADNTVEVVTATRLVERLKPLRGAKGLPHFTFLCTCESASPDAEGALGGLGQRLVRDLGMPAVIAMTEKVTVKTAQAFIEKFYFQLRASGEVDSALHEATAALAERGDVTVPALFSRLGGRPLFSDQLDRKLTNAEIADGLERLQKLLPERAPTRQKILETAAQKLGNSLGADITALSKQALEEREQALAEVNNLCEQVIDLSFNALALSQQPPTYDSRCPFLGLYPFREKNREFFFGREQLIAQLQEKLTEHNFLAVLGASGSGKSSVVLAGLIPLLQEKQPGLVMAYMTPSNQPTEKLQITLSQVKDQSSILVIDQFEELFTLCTDESVRVAFIQQLLKLTQQQKVVMTMRADFWGECAPYRQLKELMETRQKLIGPMDTSELRKAMEMQAAQVGLRFEAGLSNTILDDVQGEPGAMPLLQHAMLEMWKRRHGRWLRAEEYAAIGGVNMAIAQTADDVYHTLSLPEQDQVKNIFIRLTRLDENALQGENRRDTRRRVWLDELVPAGGDLILIKELVNRLAGEGARLVVTSVDGSSNREEVEVAHEALIRHWPRLLNWLDENRISLQLRETIRQAALEWEQEQKDENYLVHRGGRLEDAQVLSKHAGFLNQLEADYVNACVELRQRQEQEKEAHRRREVRTAWGVAGGAVVALIVSAGLGLWALREKQTAKISQAEVNSQYSLSLLEDNQDLDALVEVIKAGNILKANNQTQPVVMKALQKVVYGVRERNVFKHEGAIKSVIFSPDGKTLVSAGDDKTFKLWDLKGNVLQTFSGHEDAVTSVVFSPQGNTLASVGNDKTVKLWDLKGNLLLTLSEDKHQIETVVFSPDGEILATVSDHKIVKLWDLKGKLLETLSWPDDPVKMVVFSPKADTLATVSNQNIVKFWDLKRNLLQTFKDSDEQVTNVVFSPDGQTLATASEGKTVKLWDLNGKKLRTFKGHEDQVTTIVFSPDGQTLATGSEDTTIKLWNVKTAKKLQSFNRHQALIKNVIFSPDGKTLASVSDDKTVKLWDLQGNELQTLKDQEFGFSSVVFSPDGHYLATGSYDKTVKLWDLKGKQLQTLKGHQQGVRSAVFSPDGQSLATASDDKTIKLWDVNNGKLRQTLKGHQNKVTSVVFSPDGQRLASASDDKTVKLWDLKNGKEPQIFKGHKNRVTSVVFSPNGKTLATASNDKTAILWDLKNGKEPQIFKGHTNKVTSVVFSPNGETLASASDDKTVILWDLKNGKEPQIFKGHKKQVISVVFSPDGQHLASASYDQTVKIWDLNGNEIQTLSGHRESLTSVIFSPNGKIIASASYDNTVILWKLDELTLDSLLTSACGWTRDYFNNSVVVDNSDKHLCDRIVNSR
ncbi:CHAT domain-containing protein [Anabaena cylindrica]|uniref:WD-40 repeat-containing protein n=1 Tax=Anabaena cylindrica (strain ATCC 27899 / PCC 7122) TaxID=272123 RepID=K9ZFD9_ANACC|nr:CHAT domain-containing protein [Anabaena cylindrica]AFZ57906.1 WD-40 repeat-containing protein [Anabaena cylindrica PCC 7122]